MKTKTILAFVLLGTIFMVACKDTTKEEEELNQKLKEIETVEQTIDSTVNDVHQKAESVEDLIKELDSI
ncbi:hypothetical protein GCM10011414_13200 [Croceivirga lutea]|uniref:hypothetical protein n=1 Tax=Croceivirga lutea TaxID=1775167 RepID=UPI00163B4002|nr:hypothetical protein [Croceivirga lutea]GGG45015.1 hypothetical protein GCM10011414_13200 [Croceivirga lutea]